MVIPYVSAGKPTGAKLKFLSIPMYKYLPIITILTCSKYLECSKCINYIHRSPEGCGRFEGLSSSLSLSPTAAVPAMLEATATARWQEEFHHNTYVHCEQLRILIIVFRVCLPSWTMKSSLAPLKYVIGRWIRHGTTPVYIKGKKLWGWFSKTYFRFIFSPMSWSNGCCSGRDKGGSLVANVKGRWQRIVVLIIIIIIIYKKIAKLFHSCEELRDEEGDKVKHEEDFQNCLFFGYMS